MNQAVHAAIVDAEETLHGWICRKAAVKQYLRLVLISLCKLLLHQLACLRIDLIGVFVHDAAVFFSVCFQVIQLFCLPCGPVKALTFFPVMMPF